MQNRTFSFQTTNIIGGQKYKCFSLSIVKSGQKTHAF